MRTWKQTEQIVIMAIIAVMFTLALAACDNGGKDSNGNGENNCDCTATHYIPCTCGKTQCACTVTPRGYISEYITNVQIPIYQTVGLTDEEAIAGKDAIIEGYGLADGMPKGKLKGLIKEIWIIKEAVDDYWLYDYAVVENKIILKIQFDCEWMDGIFNDFADSILPTLGLE